MTQIILDGFAFKDEDVFDGRRSYRDGLTRYVNDTDNQVYYSGTLTYSWHLLALTRQSTGFLVYVHEGHSFAGFTLINKIVNVTEPGLPTHTCGGQMYFPQTGVVPCVCTIDSLGSPEGRLVWLLDNIAIATGDYGVTQLKFPSGNVSREHDGMMATCQLDWVQPMTAATTSHVTYRENTKLDITMTLKYVLLKVCTRVTETEVETQVHAQIIQENQEWPGICTDSACTNAHVNATCDGKFSKSITTVVEIEQVPVTVRSNANQTTGSPHDVLLQAAFQEDAFDLQTINATLNKANLLVFLLRTCTNGYVDTGTHCVKPEETSSTVKPEEPSSISPALMGSIIGGVVAFLVVVILIILVILVNRRLNRLDTGRQPSTVRMRQDDEHDYSSLTPAGHNAGLGRSGQQERVELRLQDLDLTNPSEQNKRPVSDYDVIGEENPEIAKYLAESSLENEHPDYVSLSIPQKNVDDVKDSNTVTDVNDSNNMTEVNENDYLELLPPLENGDGEGGENPADYITPCSPDESSEDKNDEDYITPCSTDESSEDKNDEDYITPCSPDESSEDKNDEDYITPCSPDESSEDKNDEDYITPCSPDESSEDKNDEDYITPCSPDENIEDKNDEDYITPCSQDENIEDKDDEHYIILCSPDEISEDRNSLVYMTQC
ncbi:uncharacterized protein [Littorina saxatilis]|uniref:uncharacterized protein n=1 Tax=Littorina saxatilis TaxID=31220 RepID=UPI0038B42183